MEFWVCETIVQLKKINKKPAIIRIANVPNYLSLHRICWVFFFIITNKLKLNHKIKSWIKDFLFHGKGPNFLCNLLPVEIRVTFKYNADQPWVYFRDICWVSSGSAFLKYVSTSGLLWIHSEFHSMVHCSHWLADPFCILQFYCL